MRSMIHFKHIFHRTNKISTRFIRDAPLFSQPRFKFIFFSVVRIVSRETLSTTSNSMSLSASICMLHWSCPSGAALQASTAFLKSITCYYDNMRQKIPRGPRPSQIKVSDKQDAILQQIIRRHSSSQSLVRRAQIVRAGTEYGRRDTQIGRDLNCSAQMVRTWRHRWSNAREQLLTIEASGNDQELEAALIEALSDRPRSGAPPTFTAEKVCQIIKVACENPAECGRPITEWTPRELAAEVIKRGIVATISPTQVGRFLKRGGLETASEPLLA